MNIEMGTKKTMNHLNQKILIVDDKVENLIAMERLLADMDVTFVRAHSGNEALKQILEHDFAIALVDVQMPDMDGFETVEFMRLEKRTQDLPVIFVSAIHKDEYYKIKGIQTGAVDFITKPIVPEILLGKVRIFLNLHKNKQLLLEEIDRRIETEAELKKHQMHLEELVAERTADLLAKTQELARSNAELEQFAYIASHDLREPLRMVSSYTQLLAKRYRGKLDSDADEFIEFAVDGARRMQTLIDDLLSLARVGTRGRPLVKVAAQEALDRALAQLGKMIEENSAVISNDALPWVMADEAQLVQLFQNLIGNAIKYRREKTPCVNITAVPVQEFAGKVAGPIKERMWVFSVSDNGIGIPPEQYERIFVIFQRLHTRGAYPGNGIGLAICRRIIERHGGRIWVESGPEKGSTFYFTLTASDE